MLSTLVYIFTNLTNVLHDTESVILLLQCAVARRLGCSLLLKLSGYVEFFHKFMTLFNNGEASTLRPWTYVVEALGIHAFGWSIWLERNSFGQKEIKDYLGWKLWFENLCSNDLRLLAFWTKDCRELTNIRFNTFVLIYNLFSTLY